MGNGELVLQRPNKPSVPKGEYKTTVRHIVSIIIATRWFYIVITLSFHQFPSLSTKSNTYFILLFINLSQKEAINHHKDSKGPISM